ncbi:hypothetical protein [Lacipirellula limnantheis]|uniref:Uncharacterized protein n=1 Tax=Lacipirellula limnantheis TaxID=2528024 RepID=A0A517TRJ1_9BACT|nr:hypothetical protein [Lacipirellula limnantheis]QDT70968.1 hypothetical protein I41_01230 [Lacipirellula limnantheis]
MSNFLEQLVREWYEYQGYFVRQNVNVGKRANGGYECELDIVAFHPKKSHLVHVEPSMDTNSWAEREKRYQRKFAAGKKYIGAVLEGIEVPDKIDQIALLVFASKKNRQTLGGGRLMIVDELLHTIMAGIAHCNLSSSAIPEQLPILRTLQLVSDYRKVVLSLWNAPSN